MRTLLIRRADVQAFALVHLVSKLGTAANDAATSLKLLEKGLSKEDLALAVLIDFPFQILFGWLAARWSAGDKPLKPVCPTLSSLAQLADFIGAVAGCDVVPTALCSHGHATHLEFPIFSTEWS